MNGPTPDEIIDRLRTVTDPCSLAMGAPIDIWALGLVEEVTVEDGRVHVGLVLTDMSCVFFRGIRDHVADAVRDLPGVEGVEVALVTDILWTPDRMRSVAPA